MKKNFYFKFKGFDNSFKSLYYTLSFGLVLILIFSVTPKLLVLKDNLVIKSVEVKNQSKNDLEKVLSGKKITEEQNDELDNLQVFEDIFQYEEIPTSSIRLTASTAFDLENDTP